MINQSRISETIGETSPNHIIHHSKRENPLVGSWSIAEELADDLEGSSIHTDTYTFYRNGSLKWTEKIDGKIIMMERGTYTIMKDRIVVCYSRNEIIEEGVFHIIDNTVSLRFDLWREAVILTKDE